MLYSSSDTMSGNEQWKKGQLSRALAKANTAVLLDNAQNFEGALEAYDEACGLLKQIMISSSVDENRRKLEAIRNTYTIRMEELRSLEVTKAVTITTFVDDRPPSSNVVPAIDDRCAGHNTYANKAEVPYKHLEVLGRGNYGLVDKVERTLPLSDWNTPGIYARKVIRTGYSHAARQQERIMSEINIVRKLRHSHVVELVETYQAGLEFGIIMSPAAEMDLKEFLAHAHEDEAIVHRTDSCLLSWIDCIVSAVSYIHHQRVRHKDLKPANILVRGKAIFITDFGISKDLIGETTGSVGDPSERSPMYCAPESNVEGERRGRSADMFSLGCIMLEMLTVLMGESLANFEEYRITNNSRAYAANHKKNYLWMIELKNKYHIKNPNTYPYMSHSRRISTKLATVAALLNLAPDDRPRASEMDGYNGAGACDGTASCFPYQDRDGLVAFESLQWPHSASLDDDELPQKVRDRRWLNRCYFTRRKDSAHGSDG
ncbi:kinase-like protein [Mytilinidion resinicola]|uniref:Serine/threonine-protein kinase ULK3 n=1 Tax=Mytilinidion resinicola TaxID=574789 RepID=A0A6A6YKV0_9PEZI|nr:kinase-like protein [Mytilinidion resinicola]KAF2809496.1 kinase-like protein [Mytilinidion resinicola]